MKWGEYSSDVQFILQQSDKPAIANSEQTKSTNLQGNSTKDVKQSQLDQQKLTNLTTIQTNNTNLTSERKSLDLRKNDLVGIVKGVPQNTLKQSFSSSISPSTPPLLTSPTSNTNKSFNQTATSAPDSSDSFTFANISPSSQIMEFNTADVRSSLDRKTSAFRESINLSDENESFRNTSSDSVDYRNAPPISSNGALAPPPYRNPPPPRTNSPPMIKGLGLNIIHQHQKSDSFSSTNSSVNNYKAQQTKKHQKYDFVKESSPSSITNAPAATSPTGTVNLSSMPNLKAIVSSAINDNDLMNDNQFHGAQYRDLLQLIKFQREKINMQQADITKVC